MLADPAVGASIANPEFSANKIFNMQNVAL